MRNPRLYKKNQRGQAIVLIAALMVALIGALGLAIDGGGMFLLYRDVQNATDAAGLSAAYSLCSGGDPAAAVAISTQMNGFVDGVNGVTITVQHPPTSIGDPKYWTALDRDNYVAIEIKAEKPSYFIQVVYDGPLEITSSTVAQCEAEDFHDLPANTAIVTLKANDCSGNTSFRQTGSSSVMISGNIYVNHDNIACQSMNIKNGGSTHFYMNGKLCAQSSASQLNIGQGFISNPWDPDGPDNNPGTTADNGKAEIDSDCADVPQLTGDAARDPLGFEGNEPYCGPNQGDINFFDGGIAPPGTYSNLSVAAGNHVTLGSGIYCVEGNTTISGILDNEANGVMIFIKGNHTWDTTNSSRVDLTAMTSGPYASVLIYSNASSGYVNFLGTSHKGLTGTIYAPQVGCSIQGADNTIVTGQFICYEFTLASSGEIKIFYQPTAAFRKPPQFGITQ